jgi:hypothetical protein
MMMAKSYDIVGYIYKADIYCPACVVREVGEDYNINLPRVILNHYAALNDMAKLLNIDWEDEYSYDSDEFPKVAFNDMLEETEYCAKCHGELE